MIFKTAGDKSKSAILFFHAMGVTGDSSMSVAECLERKFLTAGSLHRLERH